MIFDLSTSSTFLAIGGFTLGAIIGSFLNVVILRLPSMMQTQWTADAREWLGMKSESESLFNLATPASHCPHCGTSLKHLHNVPIISFLFLRGRCGYCKAPISLQYPIVETLIGVVTAYFVTMHGLSAIGITSIVFSCTLLMLAIIDQRHQLLPDQITMPFLWLGLLVNLDGLFAETSDAVLGAVVGYLSLWTIYWLFKLITGKEGMGYGDFKLHAALGAWLGLKMLPLIIFLSSTVAAVVGICAIAFAGKEKDIPMAFGPYLCISGWIALQWGDSIITWYLSSFTF